MWASLFTGCGLLIYATVAQYLEYGVVVTVASQDNDRISVPLPPPLLPSLIQSAFPSQLPAVTVCPANSGWPRSKWGGSNLTLPVIAQDSHQSLAQLRDVCYDASVLDPVPNPADITRLLFQDHPSFNYAVRLSWPDPTSRWVVF